MWGCLGPEGEGEARSQRKQAMSTPEGYVDCSRIRFKVSWGLGEIYEQEEIKMMITQSIYDEIVAYIR